MEQATAASFGRGLARLRLLLGVSQNELAQVAGVGRTSLRNLESGDGSAVLETAESLARALEQLVQSRGVSMDGIVRLGRGE